MRIVEINICDYGSTGKIMLQAADTARRAGHTVYTYSRKWFDSGKNTPTHTYFGYAWENALHQIISRIFGLEGSGSYFGTKKLLRELSRISPDIIHLHNIHGWYINYRLLFKYIKKHNIKTFWTLHDCWPFTGHCPHFGISECTKWQSGCKHCPSHREYPQSAVDNSRLMFRRKKKYFLGVPDMTLITPSRWLAGLVGISFMKDYRTRVINNGIDLDIFKPTESNFREEHDCKDKLILLGVAFGWSNKKGLDVFAALSETLDERYKIVLVGVSDDVTKVLPENIICIKKTKNQTELAQIYTAADVFVNPTREDNYPTVNMEALACGTPVVTFNTGGSPEIPDESCGSVVKIGDVEALRREIISACEGKRFSEEACISRAEGFDKKKRFEEYVALYEEDGNN